MSMAPSARRPCGATQLARGCRGQRAAIRLGQDQRRTAVVSGPERMSRYVRPDEMHTTFNFDYLKAGWNAPASARSSTTHCRHSHRSAHPPLGCCPATTRHVTSPDSVAPTPAPRSWDSTALAQMTGVPTSRSVPAERAAALLTLALPGGAYIYQGEELGLPEVEDLPVELLQGPDLGTVRAHRPRAARRVPGTDPMGRIKLAVPLVAPSVH